MKIDKRIGVGITLSCAHSDDAGRLHGHTYWVKAWFPYVGQDAVWLKQWVTDTCARFDHHCLTKEVRRAEDLAAEILTLLEEIGCVRVEISRELEGFYAEAVLGA